MDVKSKPLNIRVTPNEHAMIAEMARQEGLPVATFIVWVMRKEAKSRGIDPSTPVGQPKAA